MEFIVVAANCFKDPVPEPELVVPPLSLFWKSLLLLVIEKNPKQTAKVLNQLSSALRAPRGSLKSLIRIALKEKVMIILTLLYISLKMKCYTVYSWILFKVLVRLIAMVESLSGIVVSIW